MEVYMGIEERIENLEIQNEELRSKVEYLEHRNEERFVTAKELAAIMNCSVNNVYIKIRSGEIFATDKLGSIPRIPMSQFYQNNPKEKKLRKNVQAKDEKSKSMKELVFG